MQWAIFGQISMIILLQAKKKTKKYELSMMRPTAVNEIEGCGYREGTGCM